MILEAFREVEAGYRPTEKQDRLIEATIASQVVPGASTNPTRDVMEL